MNGTLTAPPPETTPPRRDPRKQVLEQLRQRAPALAEVSDDELLRRLRRTQPDVARALDDLAGAPRSAVLDGLIERYPNLRQQSRSDLARKVVERYPDLAQRDPNLLKEAAIDAPKPAWVQGIEYPQSLEPSRGGVPVYKPVPSAPEFYRAWQERVQREVQKYQPQPDPAGAVREALKAPPARVAAGLAAGVLGFVEAPIGLASYLGGAINRMVKRWAPGLAVDRPEDQWLLNRVSGALDRAQEFVLRLTDDPDAGWVRNFFERVLPQGAASMLGFAKGGQWMVEKLGMRPWSAVASLGGVQGANEALEKALAAGASDEDTIKNVLLGFGLGLTEAVPIAQWLARSGAAKPLIHHLTQGVEDGVQEVIQQAGMQAGAKLTYDPKASLTEGLGESALAGLALGPVGSKLMELAAARRWRNDPRFRALTFSQAFDWLFQQPIQGATTAPTPQLETVTTTPSVEAARPFTARVLEATQRPTETQPAPAPPTAPPTETTPAPTTGPTQGPAPASVPPTETAPVPAPAPVPTAHTADVVAAALDKYTDDEAAVLDSYGVNRADTIAVAQKVGLPGWLELTNPDQVGAYTAGWNAALEGVPPEQWMSRLPRRMLPVAAVGYEQGRSTVQPPASGATPAPALLKPAPAEQVLAELGYRPEDMPTGLIPGGKYFVVGQKVVLPGNIPHETDGAGRARLPVSYAWARVEDVVPSHLPDGRPNPEYRLINTRDYLRNREELQKLLGAINGWDTSLHTVLTPQSALGPPVVMAEGGKLHVVGGNTRSIAIKALPPVSFAMHTNAESAFAPMYGLPPAPADGHRYMVVRLMPRVPDALTDPKLAALLSDLLNESPGRRQSTLEMALADAAKVPLELVLDLAADFRRGEVKTDLISRLIRANLIDANTRSALLEHEEEGQMYLRALLYRMGYGEKGAAIFRAATTTPSTLMRWLPDATLQLALELRLSGADGAVLADLVGEYLNRLMSHGKAERLAQAFTSAAQQIEPGDWRYTAFIQGLGQILANELVFVRTNRGAKRVELNGSQDGIGAVMLGMLRLVREYRQDARVGTNLFGVEANLMRTLLQAIKAKVPGVIEKLEQLQGRPLGLDWGLHEEAEPYQPRIEHEVPPVVMQPDGWERLPPHPLRPILEQMSATERNNQPLQKLLNRLREQEAAERQEVRAAVEGGTPVEDAIAAVLRKRAGNLEQQRVGLHRRMWQLVRRRDRLTQAEQDELRMLERWSGQRYLDFFETTSGPPAPSSEQLLNLAAAAKGDAVFQGLLPLADPNGLAAAKLYQAANALSQATTGTPLSERPRAQQQEMLGITGDLFSQAFHEGAPAYEPGTLFPTEPGGTEGAGRQRVSRTASAPRRVEVASGGVQSALDFTGLARKRTGPVPPPETRELILRHAQRLPVVTELTHPEPDRWMQQHLPRPGALLAHQRDGVRRILANFHTGAKHFLLADGTGVGKTRAALAVAHVSAKVWGQPVLMVVPDERVISDTYSRDAADLGIELYRYRGEPLSAAHQVLVCTYTDVSRGVVDLKRFATLIFDEAHYLKNDDQLSTRADLGIQAMNQAERVLLITATPLDEPWQLWYLTRVLGKNPEAALAELGITVEYRYVNGQPRRIYRVEEEHFSPSGVQDWLERNFEEAAARGNYLQRELRLDNIEVGLQQVGLSPDDLRRVEDVYAAVLQKHVGRGMSLGHAKAVALLAARSHLETYKVQAALRLVKDRVRKGRQVVVYLHRVERVETSEQDIRPAQTLASLIEDVLGPGSVGRLYGGRTGPAAQQYAVEVMHRFRNGELPVIIATAQSGGVGLSLDDIYGDAPRSVLVLTAPFGAQDAVQIAGRVSRVTTRSKAELLFVHTGSKIDTWNLGIVLQKLAYLGAVIGPTAKALAPTKALPAKAEPALPPPEQNEPDQVRIEAMVQSLPDVDFQRTLDLEWWRRLESSGNLRTALWRWAWLERDFPGINLTGRVIKGPADLVTLGQMLRNPAFEVARVVLVNAEGKIAAVISTTAGRPGTVDLPFDARQVVDLARLARSTGAVAMYTMHNHPSGNPFPSDADLVVSRRLLRRTGREVLPKATPAEQQAYDEAAAFLRSLHKADVVIDHLSGSIITWTRDPSGYEVPGVEAREIRLEDLPPEYRQWYEDTLARSDQEILNGPQFTGEARQQYQAARALSVRELRGGTGGQPPRRQLVSDPFEIPFPVQRVTPGMRVEAWPLNQQEFAVAALALARAYTPREGRRVPLIALSHHNQLRAIFYLHPLEFTHREVLVRRLAEAAHLFGAARFAAVIDSTMGPLVREAAQEYVQVSLTKPAVLMEAVDADRGVGLAGPALAPYYAHEVAMGGSTESPGYLFREPAPAAYSVNLPPGGGKGGVQVPVHLGGMQHVQPFNMPLMLQLYQAIMGPEEAPRIRRKLRGHGVQGVFRSKDGTILLAKEIFEDPELARRVLAHELGHWIDWNPDQTLARGNLWGRLASLRKYLKQTYGTSVVTNQEFRAELIALTKWWRPWDENLVPASYSQYRRSAVELYADWISVLFNAPQEARARAPKFWQEFWAHLNTKPDIQQALLDIQTELFKHGLESSDDKLVRSILESYQTAEERMLAIADERRAYSRSLKRLMDELAQQLVDPFIPAERMERLALGGKPPTPVTAKQRRRPTTLHAATEALAMREVVNYRMLKRVHERVVQPLQEAEVSLSELGLYLQLRRIAVGDRATFGNPGGVQPEDAQRLLHAQELRLGPARTDLLRRAAEFFHAVAWEVSQRAVASGLINRNTFETRIRPNREHYATFWVVRYVSDRITPLVREQVGTFEHVANPFIATLLKLMVTNSTIAYNNAARAQVDLLTRYFPGEIQMVKADRTDAPGKGIFRFFVDGRLHFAEVDRYLAEAFRRQDAHQTWRAVRLLGVAFRKLIYPFIITYNFGYLYLIAPWKDMRRTARNLAGSRVPAPDGKGPTRLITWPSLRLLRRYPRALADAWRHYYGDDRPIIREMLDHLALGTPWDVFARTGMTGPGGGAEGEFYVRMLQKAGVVSDEEMRGVFARLRNQVLVRPIAAVLDAIEAGGLAINDAPKIAAYRLLVERGLPRHEAARFTRRYAGLPHIHRRGLAVSTFHALFPFWNVAIQGYRADAEMALDPKSAGAWWFRWANTDGLAAALAAAAGAGLLGWLLKLLYDGIPEYDKRLYTCIPVGVYRDDQGFTSFLKLAREGKQALGSGSMTLPYGWKVAYLRIPRDETSRMISGVLYNFMSHLRPEHDRPGHPFVQALAFGADQLPGLNPILTIGRAWSEYAMGRVPMDPRTGRPLLSYYQQQAGFPDSLTPMIQFTLRQMGLENFVKYDSEARTTTELAVSAIPGVNRLIKISDYGYREQQQRVQAAAAERELKSEHMLRYPPDVRRALAEYRELSRLSPQVRTWQQQARLSEINYWRTNVFQPVDRLVLELERQGKRGEARKYREFAAERYRELQQLLARPPATAAPER